MNSSQNGNSGRRMKNTPNQNNKNSKRARNRPRERGPNQTRYCPKEIVRECTRNYLRVLTDPWAHFNSGKEVCIPDAYSKPSWKVQTFARGVLYANASGQGALLVEPHSAAWSNEFSIAFSDQNSLTGTLATLASIKTTNARAPFLGTSTIDCRLVGCGIRIKYIGKYLDTAGLYGLGIKNSADDDLKTITPDSFLSRPSVVRSAVTHGGRWQQVAFRPSQESTTEPRHGTGGVVGNNVPMAVVIQGAEPSAPFEYEICFFHEYFANDDDVVPGTTESHSDILGLSAIRSYINKVWNSPITTDLYNKGMDYVYKYLTSGTLSLMGQGTKMIAF